jgi:DNA invertase Pin-like site-specific DNA recombinase
VSFRYSAIVQESDTTLSHQAVSGADPIASRPGFQAMLERIAGNGVRTIIVETANRFAGDLMVQEVGWAMLRDMGVSLVAVDSLRHFWTMARPPS